MICDGNINVLSVPQHLRLFLDNSDLGDIVQFFDSYYSHIYFIVYDSFVNAEQNLRQKGAHKAQREELEGVRNKGNCESKVQRYKLLHRVNSLIHYFTFRCSTSWRRFLFSSQRL